MNEIERLKDENKKLRIAARLIHQRGIAKSGSKEMGDIDAYCKKLDLMVWKWPLGNFWDIDISHNNPLDADRVKAGSGS